MKTIMILGGPYFQIPLIRAAKERGLYTCVLDYNENAAGKRYADSFFQCSLKDTKKALQIAKEVRPIAVTAGMCDVAVCTCSVICEELGLPSLPLEKAMMATNKFLMIEAFRENGVPHPEYRIISINEKEHVTEISELVEGLEFPLITKPIDMAGSRGINYVSDIEELKNALDDSFEASDNNNILVEEFMSGPEVSVELVVKDRIPKVIQITDKITSGPPHFVEVGHSQPTAFADNIKSKIANVAIKAIRSLGLSNCIVHAELIVTDEGPKMVELGARMGGDSIQQQLLMLSSGIDMPKLAIKIALGEKFDYPKPTQNMSSAIMFIPSKKGRIKHIEVSVSEDEMYDDKKIELFCKEGDHCDDAIDNSKRIGYVLTQSKTADKAIANCKDLLSKIKISYC